MRRRNNITIGIADINMHLGIWMNYWNWMTITVDKSFVMVLCSQSRYAYSLLKFEKAVKINDFLIIHIIQFRMRWQRRHWVECGHRQIIIEIDFQWQWYMQCQSKWETACRTMWDIGRCDLHCISDSHFVIKIKWCTCYNHYFTHDLLVGFALHAHFICKLHLTVQQSNKSVKRIE